MSPKILMTMRFVPRVLSASPQSERLLEFEGVRGASVPSGSCSEISRSTLMMKSNLKCSFPVDSLWLSVIELNEGN